MRKVKFRLISKDLDETEFSYKGNNYVSKYGNYTMNGKPTTKQDYHKVRKRLMNIEDPKDSFDYILNLPSKVSSKKVQEFHDFISSISYDKDYDVGRPTRGHITRIDRDDTSKRVSSIMEDSGLSSKESLRVNQLIKEYTSTRPPKILGKDKDILDKYLDNTPVYKGSLLYRGMGFNETNIDKFNLFKSYNIGNVIEFIGYTSFSSNEDVALNFAESNGNHQVFLILTKNLSGVSIDHLSSLPYPEEEILYKDDKRLIIKDKSIKDNTIYFQVEELSINEDNYDNGSIKELPIKGSMCLGKFM